MTVALNPYLGFRDTAREAIEFYHSVFGGELTMSTFGEMYASEDEDEGEKDKIMHAMLTSPNGLVLMASDTPNSMEYQPGGSISVSLSGDDDDLLREYWDKLAVGATVTAPFERAPWGDLFGMCIDRFGVNWMVNATPQAT